MRVCFICLSSTHVYMFHPVMRTLEEQGGEYVCVSLENYYHWDANQALESLQIPYIQFGQPQPKRIVDLSLPQMYARIYRIVPQIKALYDEYQPHVLLVGNDRGLVDKQFIRIANERQIRTILVQDGLLWTSEVRSLNWQKREDKSLRRVFRDLLKEMLSMTLSRVNLNYLAPKYMGQGGCSYIAVMGEATKRVLVARGCKSESIVVVGQPRYDDINYTREKVQELKKRLDIPAEGLVLSVFTSAYQTNLFSTYLQKQQEEFVNRFVLALSQALEKDVILLLKPHPRENAANYIIESNGRLSLQLIQTGFSSLDIIAISNFVLTVPSTILAEISLLQKQFLVIKLGVSDQVTTRLGVLEDSCLEYDCPEEAASYFMSILDKDFTVFPDMLATQLVQRDSTTASHKLVALINNIVNGDIN